MSETVDRPAGAPVWMRILLVLSLVVNVLILGVVIGAFARWGDGEHRDHLRGARDLAPPPFVLAFEREERRALVRDLRGRTAGMERGREAVRTDLRAILAALRSDAFDADAVRALLAAERQRSQGRQAAGEDVFVDYLEGLSPDERRAYADRLERILRRMARR